MAYGIPVGCRWLGIEKAITANAGADFTFDDDKTINNSDVFVFAVQGFCSTQLTKTPGGSNLISNLGITGLTIFLQDKTSTDRALNVPYYDTVASLNTGYPREIEPFNLNLTKSGVHITDTTNIVSGQAVYIVLWYMYKEDMIARGIKIPDQKPMQRTVRR